MRNLASLLLVAAFGCSGCSTPVVYNPDVGPYRTPIHAYGFVSCSDNTPIPWIRGDAAADENLRIGVIAHENQHVLDFAMAGGCVQGYAAYVANPLHFEARAYCAGAHALADRRLAPPVADQIPLMAVNVQFALEVSYEQATRALQDACFTRIYTNAP